MVGPNGMGKSTLLKIMAGLETVSNGEACITPGFTVGILQQEPPLDDTKTVGENIKHGVRPVSPRRSRVSTQIGEEMANPDADFDALMDEMGKLQTEIDAANGWDLDSQLEQAMDALQCPRHGHPGLRAAPVASVAVWHCASCCIEAPDLLLLDEPTNHLDAESILWLEQFLHLLPGRRHRRHPRPLLPGQRGRMDLPRSTAATCTRTRATTPRTWRRRRSVWRSRAPKDAKLAKRLKERARMGAQLAPRPVRPRTRHVWRATSRWQTEARNAHASSTSPRSRFRPGPRLGTVVHGGRAPAQGLSATASLIDDLSFTLPRNGIVGVIGPNGVGKSTLFKTIVGLEPLDGPAS